MASPSSLDISKLVNDEIERRINEIINEEVKDIAHRVEKKVRNEVGQIISRVTEHFSFERFERQIVIKVHFDNFDKK